MSKLVMETINGVERLCWWIEEDDCAGGVLGDDSPESRKKYMRSPLDSLGSDEREIAVACRTAANSEGVRTDNCGFWWESESLARKAYTAIRTAWKADKSERPWPQWAIEATNAGWKAPKGLDAVKRYTKKQREDAAMICAIAASGGAPEQHIIGRRRRVYSFISDQVGLDLRAGSWGLAIGAYHHVMDALNGPWTVEVDAEAEALIRTGWTP